MDGQGRIGVIQG